MFLEYLALVLLLLSVTAIFYIFIYIHDLPYRTAKQRNHPNQEAIHYACWLSLFTLHAIWPLVYIWAVTKRSPFPIEIQTSPQQPQTSQEMKLLYENFEEMKRQLDELKKIQNEKKNA
jgi:ABC-type uncharacterized transport system YnjBCD permease subunit